MEILVNMQRQKILIYQDYGCSDVTYLFSALQEYFLPRGKVVGFTDSGEILKNNVLNDEVALFVMPGGAATPFLQKLQTLGNEKIRDYINNGGNYLGICAGAYYGCAKVDFEKGVPGAEISRTSGLLNLLNAEAVGTLRNEFNLRPFARNASASAAVRLVWKNDQELLYSHYHGGSKFVGSSDDFEILARYSDVEDMPAAIIGGNLGKGRVILSGVHFEDRGEDLSKALNTMRIDYQEAFTVAEKLIKNEKSRQLLFHKIMGSFEK